jgi:hypothetical protein
MVVSLTRAIGEEGLLRRPNEATNGTGTFIGYHSRHCFAMAIFEMPSIRHTDCKVATLRIFYGANRQICDDPFTDSCYLDSRRKRDFGFDL